MGWCSGDGEHLPICGTWRLTQAGDNYGRMLAELADVLVMHIEQHRPDEVAYESPIIIFNQRYKDREGQWRRRNDNLATLRKTIPLGPRIEEVCWRKGIPCGETSIESVKKELAGFAKADKAAMVAAAEKLGITLPEGPAAEDAADACGGWLLFLRMRSRHLSAKFDAALWGGRANTLI